jgi:hypothetical protein
MPLTLVAGLDQLGVLFGDTSTVRTLASLRLPTKVPALAFYACTARSFTASCTRVSQTAWHRERQDETCSRGRTGVADQARGGARLYRRGRRRRPRATVRRAMSTARCLCGDVTWELEGPFRWMSHCHCSRCRKAHGSAYATYVAGSAKSFRLSGADHVVKWESLPDLYRCFCGHCGSVVPSAPFGELMFVPVGSFDEDPGARPSMHIFAASKAPWFEIKDSLARFDTYPPGVDAPVVPDRAPLDPPGTPRASCLCGSVRFVVEGEPLRCWTCHCGRCRRARSAAFASNLITSASSVRFTLGADLVREYKLPEAKHFKHAFCRLCGSSMPRIDTSRDLAIVPMGSFDDDPGMHPQAHIFVGAMAAWDTISDSLPQHAEYPPPN